MIELAGVSRVFEAEDGVEVVALDDVSVRIRAGEFVCITGPSGSGKSTLLNLLGCLDRPTGGKYRIANRDAGTLTVDGLARLRRAMFGFMFQGPSLLDGETVAGNVALPARYAGMPRERRRQRVRQLLEQMGVDRLAGCAVDELSGGEQQRVAMARAMINDPAVLFADEPTGALDSEQGRNLLSHLVAIAGRGSTVVVATHDSGVAAQAGRRIELLDGRVVADSGSATAGRTAAQCPNAAREALGGPLDRYGVLRDALVSFARGGPRRGRSLLAFLGVALGVWSAVTLLSVVQGTYQEHREQAGSLGADQITVSSGSFVHDLDVSPADARAIEDGVANVRTAVVGSHSRLEIRYGETAVEAELKAGGIPDGGLPTFRYKEYAIDQGAFLHSQDDSDAAHVVVLSDGLRDALFPPGADPVGDYVLIDGTPFLVKGVLAPHPIMQLPVYQEVSSLRPEPLVDLSAYVPYNAARASISTMLGPYLEVFARDPDDVDEVARDVRDLLYRRHGEVPLNILVHAELFGGWEDLRRQEAFVFGGVAVIVLLTSGLGVTASMLSSLNLRRREIGIRMANGARPRDILRQLLAEAVMLTVAAGTAGMLLPLMTGPVVESVTDVSVAYASWFMPVSLGSAVLVGLIFGVVPAYRSARLEPALALKTA